MKKIVLGALVLAVLLLAGCSSLTVPYGVTDNPVGSKTGEVTESYLFGQILPNGIISGIPMGGDFTLSGAAANGGITKISTVEVRVDANPFILKRTLIVTGN
jgi:PBP1b-binding outer membrane lipoprotein LpoB